MTKREDYNTQKYWEKRLSSRIDLRGTGHRAFDLEYNRWFYLFQSDSLNLLLDRNKIQLNGRSAVDIGSGNGFYIDFMLKYGVDSIIGLDITQASVEYLHEKFPECVFIKADIADTGMKLPYEFDILTAISILFHIVDDQKFKQAIQNIGNLLKPGGYAILSDTFSDSYLNLSSHVRFRNRLVYEQELAQAGLKILDTIPMHFFLNRTIIPFFGPRILSFIRAGKLLYKLDSSLLKRGWGNWNGGKLLLAQKIVQ